MHFLDKLSRSQRDKVIRKIVALESVETKPTTQAELAKDVLRRTLGRGKSFLTGDGRIDYIG